MTKAEKTGYGCASMAFALGPMVVAFTLAWVGSGGIGYHRGYEAGMAKAHAPNTDTAICFNLGAMSVGLPAGSAATLARVKAQCGGK